MKQLKLVLALVAVVGIVTACSKDDNTPSSLTTIDLAGIYVGKANIGNQSPVQGFNFNIILASIQAGTTGIIIVETGSTPNIITHTGNWVKVGADSLTGSYTNPANNASFGFSAKYNSLTKILKGTYGTGAGSLSGAGNFEVTKQ